MSQIKDIEENTQEESIEITHPETLSVWGLAWPPIVGNLLFASVGVISIKAVGTLGAEAVAAVGTGQRMVWVFQALLMAVMTGTTALVARAVGSKNMIEAAHVTRLAIGVSIALSLITTLVIVLFAEKFIGIFGLDPVAQELAVTYLTISILFIPFMAIGMVIGAALRAAGDVKTPMYIGIFTNIIAIYLLLGLVNGQYGMPKLGILGAALAMGISFAIGAAIQLYLWLANKLVVPLGKAGSFTKERLRQLITISYPAGIESFVFQFGMLSFFWIVAMYGTEEVAAYNIGVNILMLSFILGNGFSVAAATLSGQFLGASDPVAAYKSGYQAAGMTMLAMSLSGLLLAFFAEPIAWFFIQDEEVVKFAVIFVWIFAMAQPFMALEFSLGSTLRGAGDTRSPLVITIIGLLVIRVPIAFLLYYLEMPVQWIFATLIIDYFVKGILLITRYRSKRWMKVLKTSS
ncbi:MAG TPA: MATE family efflux transporter [Gammaproteobacteria bacterium]|jgi:putative MATE family efflux protein|nr:MATE family efflux transporter [Gammaproteobacteria bacterium]